VLRVETRAARAAIIKVLNTSHGKPALCDNKKGQAQQKEMLLPKDQSIKIEYGHR